MDGAGKAQGPPHFPGQKEGRGGGQFWLFSAAARTHWLSDPAIVAAQPPSPKPITSTRGHESPTVANCGTVAAKFW